MPVSRLEYLFKRYLDQQCSDSETKELMVLLEKSENECEVKALIDQVVENTGLEMRIPQQVEKNILRNILREGRMSSAPVEIVRQIPILRMCMTAAACLILLIGVAYWVIEGKAKKEEPAVATLPNRIVPGTDKAVLTLADGSVRYLDNVQNGNVAEQGDSRVSKQDGLLTYRPTKSQHKSEVMVYNSLATPRGGQYQLILPDGSKAWLNSASSLRFPTAFKGNNREVILNGEAYFEIAKDAKKPFQVTVGKMKINVLGTHFNINAYDDENTIRTSLLEGSVKIENGESRNILKPGQQATLGKTDDKIKITNADLEEVIAWKNGLFQFDGANITSIMRQVGRWYDVEIVYAGKIPVFRFEGKISRKSQLSEVLQILELNDIRLKIDQKKIIIY